MLLWQERLELKFQSTLPRGSDVVDIDANKDSAISIHAPSRERPNGVPVATAHTVISIHAPSRERQITILHLIF